MERTKEIDNQLISVIERINSDRIQMLNNKEVLLGRKIVRILNEIRTFKIKKLLKHISIRFNHIKINTVGADANYPDALQAKLARRGRENIKVAIYTCVTGNYDKVQSPYIKFDNCDYFLFSDSMECEGWERRSIPLEVENLKNNSLINRYIKFHPHEFFATDYDYSIYLDGNVTPLSDLSVLTELINEKVGLAFHRHCSRNTLRDEMVACTNLGKGNSNEIEKQVERYINEGMPNDYGLIEGNVIVCNLHNETAYKLCQECWQELIKCGGGRDQLVWPYIFWKNNISVEDVGTLGYNVWKNPKFVIGGHND